MSTRTLEVSLSTPGLDAEGQPTHLPLGVRLPPDPYADVEPDAHNHVSAGQGMSVAPAWRDLPFFLIPRRLNRLAPKARGSNSLVCWRAGDGEFTDGRINDQLRLRQDRAKHGIIEPAERMAVDAFQAAIAATRDDWQADEE